MPAVKADDDLSLKITESTNAVWLIFKKDWPIVLVKPDEFAVSIRSRSGALVTEYTTSALLVSVARQRVKEIQRARMGCFRLVRGRLSGSFLMGWKPDARTK